MNDEWVDRQIGLLDTSREWEPDRSRAWRRLQSNAKPAMSGTGRIWVMAIAGVTVAASAAVVMLPSASQKGAPASVSASDRAIKIGDFPPDFTLTDDTGKPIHLAAYRGSVVVVNFWATWCGGCKQEIPALQKLASTYDAQGLKLIGISTDDDGWKSVKPYLRDHPIGYPIVIGDEQLGSKFGLSAMPMTYVLGRDGRVATTHVGVIDPAAFEREIVRLLKRPQR